MTPDHPLASLLSALDVSIVQLEAHLRKGHDLPSPGILPSRRRATAMLRAALRYSGWRPLPVIATRVEADAMCSELALWKAERRIVQLYREAIMQTPADAAEYRLLCEQCAVAEQGLLRFAKPAHEWTPPERAQTARHA